MHPSKHAFLLQVKLGCLENVMLKKIEEARSRELRYLRCDSFFWSIMAFLACVSTVVVTTATVGLYVAIEDHTFTAANLFSAMALLGQLTVCLSVFPVTVPIFIKGMVSRQRLMDFFARDEVTLYRQKSSPTASTATANKRPAGIGPRVDSMNDSGAELECEEDDDDDEEEDVNGNGGGAVPSDELEDLAEEDEDVSTGSASTQPPPPPLPPPSPTSPYSTREKKSLKMALPEYAFDVVNATFAWPKTSTVALRDVTLRIRPATLTVVTGPSGGGKTALLHALAGEMDRLAGDVQWHLSSLAVALSSQRPWLLNASVSGKAVLLAKERRQNNV